MDARWFPIWALWGATAILAVVTVTVAPAEHAFAWFGAILTGSVATVSLIHLIKASPAGFVRELIYVGGGSYLILAVASVYLFLRG